MTFIFLKSFHFDLSAQWVNPMESVGMEHNRLVKSVFPAEIDKAKSKSGAISIVDNTILESYPELRWVTKRSWTSPIVELNYLTEENYISSQVQELIFNDLTYILENDPSVSVIDNYVSGRGQIASAIKTLSKNDQNHYFSFLAGLSYSAKIWLPKNKGGEDLNSTSGGTGTIVKRHFNPWKALGCDAVGCIVSPPAGGAATLCSIINQWQW